MAYEKNTIDRLLRSGLALAFLPIFPFFVLGTMVKIGWIVNGYSALVLTLCGILLAVSLFGVGLFVVGFLMAYKNVKERD